ERVADRLRTGDDRDAQQDLLPEVADDAEEAVTGVLVVLVLRDESRVLVGFEARGLGDLQAEPDRDGTEGDGDEERDPPAAVEHGVLAGDGRGDDGRDGHGSGTGGEAEVGTDIEPRGPVPAGLVGREL